MGVCGLSQACAKFQRYRSSAHAARTKRATTAVSLFTSPNNSAFALLDELDYLNDLFCLRQFFLHRFERLSGIVFRAVDQAERFFDQLHAFGGKIFAFQAD